MGIAEHIRLPVPAPASVVPASAGPELEMDELEQVVGGLERAYLPGIVAD